MKRLMLTDSEKLDRRRELGRKRAVKWRQNHPRPKDVIVTMATMKVRAPRRTRSDLEKLARRRELGKIRAATYREKHPGKIKERNEAHYQKNKYEIRAHQAKAYAANPERFKEYNLKSIKKNRGCVSCRDWPDWREGWKHYDGHC